MSRTYDVVCAEDHVIKNPSSSSDQKLEVGRPGNERYAHNQTILQHAL